MLDNSNSPNIAALCVLLAARPYKLCLLCRVAELQAALNNTQQSVPAEPGMPEAGPAPGKLHQDLQDATQQVTACLGSSCRATLMQTMLQGHTNDQCFIADCRAEAAAGHPANSRQAGQQRSWIHAAQ